MDFLNFSFVGADDQKQAVIKLANDLQALSLIMVKVTDLNGQLAYGYYFPSP